MGGACTCARGVWLESSRSPLLLVLALCAAVRQSFHMRAVFLFFLALAAPRSTWGQANEQPAQLEGPDVVIVDGHIYKRAGVVLVESNGVTYLSSGYVKRLGFDELLASVREAGRDDIRVATANEREDADPQGQVQAAAALAEREARRREQMAKQAGYTSSSALMDLGESSDGRLDAASLAATKKRHRRYYHRHYHRQAQPVPTNAVDPKDAK